MKLKRFLLRYFPPGIILEYENNGETKQKTVDLLDLTVDTDAEVLLVRNSPCSISSCPWHCRNVHFS
jgi:hypothetical protein